MKSVTMLELRRNPKKIINRVARGEVLVLTYRGAPAMRLNPVQKQTLTPDDPFYSICDLAVEGSESLSNEEIDKIIYS